MHIYRGGRGALEVDGIIGTVSEGINLIDFK